MQPPRLLPPHYFILSVITIVAFDWLLDGGLVPGWGAWLGLPPMLAGVAIAVAASNHFKRVDTNIIPLTRSSTLVTSGMFGYTRNPMYLGMLFFLIGLSVLLDQLAGLLVAALFFFFIRQHFVMREETLLQDTFGEAYQSYRNQVRRWI